MRWLYWIRGYKLCPVINRAWTFWNKAFRHTSGYRTSASRPPGDWLSASGVTVIGNVVFSSTCVSGLVCSVGRVSVCAQHLFHLFTLDLPLSGAPFLRQHPTPKNPCPEWLLSCLTKAHLCLGGAFKNTWFSQSKMLTAALGQGSPPPPPERTKREAGGSAYISV